MKNQVAQQGEEALGQEVQQACQGVREEEIDERDCPKDYSRHVCDLQSSYLTLSEAAFVPAAACAALYASIQRTLHIAFKQLQVEHTRQPILHRYWILSPGRKHVG